jgi:hypothetical protein
VLHRGEVVRAVFEIGEQLGELGQLGGELLALCPGQH